MILTSIPDPAQGVWHLGPGASRIDAAHRPAGTADIATYHPTFLYESLWCVRTSIIIFAVAVAFLILGRRGQPAPLAGAAPDEPAGSDGERAAGSGERSVSR